MEEYKLILQDYRDQSKHSIQKDGWDWDKIRDQVIKHYGNQCQASGKYIDKYLFVKLKNADRLRIDIGHSDEHGIHYLKEDYSNLGKITNLDQNATVICEAANLMMFAKVGYQEEWVKPYVRAVWSDVWDQNQILKAYFAGVADKQFFQKYIWHISLLENDGDELFGNKNEIKMDTDTIQLDQPITAYDYLANNQVKEFSHTHLVLIRYDEERNMSTLRRVKMRDPLLESGIRIMFTKKYDFKKRNKESLSLKIKHNKKGGK